MKAFWRQRVTKSTNGRKEAAEIEIFIMSEKGDKKYMNVLAL